MLTQLETINSCTIDLYSRIITLFANGVEYGRFYTDAALRACAAKLSSEHTDVIINTAVNVLKYVTVLMARRCFATPHIDHVCFAVCPRSSVCAYLIISTLFHEIMGPVPYVYVGDGTGAGFYYNTTYLRCANAHKDICRVWYHALKKSLSHNKIDALRLKLLGTPNMPSRLCVYR